MSNDFSGGGRVYNTSIPAPRPPAAFPSPAISPAPSPSAACTGPQPPADCGGHGSVVSCTCQCTSGYASDFTNLLDPQWCVAISSNSGGNSTTGSRDQDLINNGGIVYNSTNLGGGGASGNVVSSMLRTKTGTLVFVAILVLIFSCCVWYFRRRCAHRWPCSICCAPGAPCGEGGFLCCGCRRGCSNGTEHESRGTGHRRGDQYRVRKHDWHGGASSDSDGGSSGSGGGSRRHRHRGLGGRGSHEDDDSSGEGGRGGWGWGMWGQTKQQRSQRDGRRKERGRQWPAARARMNAVGGAQHQLAIGGGSVGPDGLAHVAPQEMTMLTQQMAALLAATMAQPLPVPHPATAAMLLPAPYGLPTNSPPTFMQAGAQNASHMPNPLYRPWLQQGGTAGSALLYNSPGAQGMASPPGSPMSRPLAAASAPVLYGSGAYAPGSGSGARVMSQLSSRPQVSQSADRGIGQVAAGTSEWGAGQGRGRARAVERLALESLRSPAAGGPSAAVGYPVLSASSGNGSRSSAGGPPGRQHHQKQQQQHPGKPPQWSSVYDNPLKSEEAKGSAGPMGGRASPMRLQAPAPAVWPPRRA